MVCHVTVAGLEHGPHGVSCDYIAGLEHGHMMCHVTILQVWSMDHMVCHVTVAGLERGPHDVSCDCCRFGAWTT